MSGRRDRVTIPTDMRDLARQSDRDFEAASSDIRPMVPLHAVPWLIVTLDQVMELPLDTRAGRLLSLIDGRSTVEMILDMAGMPEDEAIAVLARLVELEVIELHDR